MNETITDILTGPISVHVMSEHIFCPRAMAITHSSSPTDRGMEPSILRLDYSPCYELEALEAALARQARLLWLYTAAAAMLALLGCLLSVLLHWSFFWSGLLAAVVPGYSFYHELPKTWHLLTDCRAMQRAKPIEPSEHPKEELVNWWSLRAAGYVSHPVEEPQTDVNLNLVGKPWRILRRGQRAIPVFVRRGEGELTPQQRSRIAAYCHLIQVNENAESPFGIVLNPGTFEGLAVKPTERDLQRAKRALKQIPRVLTDWQTIGSYPPLPVNAEHFPCRRCPHGEPRRYQPAKTQTFAYDKKIPVYATHPLQGRRVFNSPCGDHFQWIPDHELSKELSLRPAFT